MKKYWITDSRFKIILVFFFIMWLGLMGLFYLKAEEVTKNPCQICAKKIGEEVLCTYGKGFERYSIVFYPNFTVEEVKDDARRFVLPEN